MFFHVCFIFIFIPLKFTIREFHVSIPFPLENRYSV